LSSKIFKRNEAFLLLCEFTENNALIRHALSVEAAMMHFSAIFDEDSEKWGITGLLHDFAYDRYPEEHCSKAKEILEERNWPDEYIRAVQSHGWKICSDIEPVSSMEKVLYTIDELTGLITASALVRPSKSVLDLEAGSVLKKWNQKNFAAGADRKVIEEGAGMLEMDLGFIVEETIQGMKKAAFEIGLKGSLQLL
jgi:predicted hydrolase (HD superfamily)